MPMTLYNANVSPYAARVRMQIHAKGLENEVIIAPRPAIEDYRQITPIGKVPCLDVGGASLPESEVIAEFLEDSYPEPSLRGHTALGKARVRLCSRLVDLYHLPAMFDLFGAVNAPERDEARLTAVIAKLDQALGFIENHLEGPLYAAQGRFTLADCALVPALFFHTAMDPAIGRAPFAASAKVGAYYEAITRDDRICADVVEELADGLKQLMRARRG